jgi:hypothetical protein
MHAPGEHGGGEVRYQTVGRQSRPSFTLIPAATRQTKVATSPTRSGTSSADGELGGELLELERSASVRVLGGVSIVIPGGSAPGVLGPGPPRGFGGARGSPGAEDLSSRPTGAGIAAGGALCPIPRARRRRGSDMTTAGASAPCDAQPRQRVRAPLAEDVCRASSVTVPHSAGHRLAWTVRVLSFRPPGALDVRAGSTGAVAAARLRAGRWTLERVNLSSRRRLARAVDLELASASPAAQPRSWRTRRSARAPQGWICRGDLGRATSCLPHTSQKTPALCGCSHTRGKRSCPALKGERPGRQTGPRLKAPDRLRLRDDTTRTTLKAYRRSQAGHGTSAPRGSSPPRGGRRCRGGR